MPIAGAAEVTRKGDKNMSMQVVERLAALCAEQEQGDFTLEGGMDTWEGSVEADDAFADWLCTYEGGFALEAEGSIEADTHERTASTGLYATLMLDEFETPAWQYPSI
jgi:hypothetical protein